MLEDKGYLCKWAAAPMPARQPPPSIVTPHPPLRGTFSQWEKNAPRRFLLNLQRMPASINDTSPPIVCGVTTPAPVLRLRPGILYLAVNTHCSTGMKPWR